MTARANLKHAAISLNAALHENDAYARGFGIDQAQTYAQIGILEALIDLADALKDR